MLRKIFLVVICAVLATNTAMAITTGYKDECFRTKDGSGAKNVHYWNCGKQSADSCRGLVRTKSMKKHDYYHGNSLTLEGVTYICCHGSTSVQGKWIKGTQQKTYYDKTIDVGGGTCTYKITHDICDDADTGTPCTVPDTCPSGKILRNKECATLCSSGQGFQSATSNTCIACSGTDRGVDTNKICVVCTGGQKWNGTRCEAPKEETCSSGQGKDSSGKCVACSGETKGVDANGNCKTCASGQIWDSGTKACKDKPQETPKEEPKQEEPKAEEPKQETPKTDTGCKSFEYESPVSGKCISKSAAKQYSRDMFYKCYACATDTRFKSCLDIYRRAPDNLSGAQEKVLRACNIDPSTYNPTEAKEDQSKHESGLGKKSLPKYKESTTKAIGTPIKQSEAIDLNTIGDVAYDATDMLAL